MYLLDPISHALAGLITTVHHALSAVGADPAAGSTWLMCIAAVVVTVRLALLPSVVHSVRLARASAAARPQLQQLAQRYRNRTDSESVRRLMDERRRITAEHGMSRLGCLPALVQLPIWFALYHLVAEVASGTPVGAMNAELVASLGAATILGVPLAERSYFGAGLTHFAVVAGMAATAAALSYLAQRFFIAPNTITEGLPAAAAAAQQWMPAAAAGGLLLVGGVVPVALLVYWICNSTWTLGQSVVVWRWYPTPGSRAATRATRA